MKFGQMEKKEASVGEVENLKELENSLNKLDGLLTGFADLSASQKITYGENPYKEYVNGLQVRLNVIRDYVYAKQKGGEPRFDINLPVEKINNDVNTIIRDLEFDFRFLGLNVNKDDVLENMTDKDIEADENIAKKLEQIKNGPIEHANFKTFSELENRLSYLDSFMDRIKEAA